MYGNGQSIEHPMHTMQIDSLENTINHLNMHPREGKGEEDEFIIRKDVDVGKQTFSPQKAHL